MRPLTKEDVLWYIESGELEYANEMDFSGYTHIEEDAAKCIAEEGRGGIFFWNMPHFTISDEAASWLVQWKSPYREFHFFPSEKLEMSVEAAQIFAADIKEMGSWDYRRQCRQPGEWDGDFYAFENCSKDVALVLRIAGLPATTAHRWPGFAGLNTLGKARISKAQLQREAKRLKIVGYTRMSMEALQEAVLAVLLAPPEAILTPAERKKIKKLINFENLSTACELLKSADAKEGDWLAVFSKSKIKSLVDTWDATTWNTLVAEMQPFSKVYELLNAALEKRINYEGSDLKVYHRFGKSLKSVLKSSSEDLKSLIDTLLTSMGMRYTISGKKITWIGKRGR